MEGITFYFDWEIKFMEWLQAAFGSGVFAAIANFLSMFGEELIAVGVIGIVYLGIDKKAGKIISLNLIMGTVLTPMFKNVFFRRRPYFESDKIDCLRPVDKKADIYDIHAQGFSFPSGHSTTAASVFASLYTAFKKNILAILAVIIPVLVAFSRVFLGNHYPTDVLAGLAVGYILAFLLTFIQRKVKNIKILYAVLLVISLCGLFYCKTSDYFTGLGMLIGFMGAALFEERFVNFEISKNIPVTVLRVATGGAIFFGLNTVLKLPFNKAFLANGSFVSSIVRTCRYALTMFVTMGLYPMTFKIFARSSKE